MNRAVHPFWVLIALSIAALIGATEQPSAELHRIPARPVRQMLAAQSALVPPLPSKVSSQTVVADPLQLPGTLSVRKIIIGISRPLVMQPGPPDPTATLILEPMTNGCFLVVVTNAAPDITWTIQTSTNLTCCWTDGLSMSNAASYVFTNCFPDGVDNMFLRLLDP